MSGFFDRAKITAEIAKLGAEIYAIIVDKRRDRDSDARIKALEEQVAELKRRLGVT